MPFRPANDQERQEFAPLIQQKAKDKKNFLEKAGEFLGIENFGKGMGTTIFLMTPEGRNLQKKAQEGDQYAVQELLKLMDNTPTNKQIVGSAALTGINILGGGALKGAKALRTAGKVAMGSATGAAYGASGAANDNKGFVEGVRQTAVGAVAGGALTVAGVLASKAKNAIAKGGEKLAENTANTAIRPTLEETRKAVKYGQDTLGKELIKRGITGSDKKLVKVAEEGLTKNEEALQQILSNSTQTIKKKDLQPYFESLVRKMKATPGMKEEAAKVAEIVKQFPKEATLSEANKIKRNLYSALSDRSFKMDPSLSTKKEAMKTMALAIKKEIEQRVGNDSVKGLNKEIGFYLRLGERAGDNIARAARNSQLSIGDMALAGVGGVAGGIPGAVVGATARKALGSTGFKTRAAVSVDRLSKAIGKMKADTAGRISKKALLNALNQYMNR